MPTATARLSSTTGDGATGTSATIRAQIGRLHRARRIQSSVPRAAALPERLGSVLEVIYLVFRRP